MQKLQPVEHCLEISDFEKPKRQLIAAGNHFQKHLLNQIGFILPRDSYYYTNMGLHCMQVVL